MEQHLDNLATVGGRKLLQKYWHENIVEAHRWKLGLILSCWRLCMYGKTLYLAEASYPIAIEHSLGLRLGTRVWMEEIIYKHFSSTIQAFVYFGAVVLLLFVGMRFADIINERTALIGIGFEALMLFVLFIMMFYTPEEAYLKIDADEQTPAAAANDYLPLFKEIYDELQDIGTMNAALGRHLGDMANKQESYLKELSQKLSVPPSTGISRESEELMSQLRATMDALNDNMREINANIRQITGKELEYLVRREMERLLHVSPGEYPVDANRDSARAYENAPAKNS